MGAQRIDQVNNGLARAMQLMNDDNFMRLVEGHAGSKNKKGVKGGSASDLALMEQQAFGFSNSSTPSMPTQQYTQQNQTPNYNYDANMPNNILESFKQMPPLSGDGVYVDNGFGSATSLLEERLRPQAQKMQQAQMAQSMPSQVPGNMDSNYLRYMINEAVKTALQEALTSGMLNEGVIKGMRMSTGNKIQFLDTKGNLYEGTLVLKKKK